jgi:hypothetical protein
MVDGSQPSRRARCSRRRQLPWGGEHRRSIRDSGGARVRFR